MIPFPSRNIVSDAMGHPEGENRMAVRKGKGKKPSDKRKRRSRRATRDSATWEEHNERVRYAVVVGTERFLRENKERIERSSGESVARNSYLSGMLDMLSIARGTFGFWGADQILNELERANRRFAKTDPGQSPEDVEFGEECGEALGAVPGPQTGLRPDEAVGAKVSKGLKRDPMFA